MGYAHSLAAEDLLAGISERQFYDAFRDLQRQLEAKIDERANGIEKKLDDHAAEDRDLFTKIGNRVLIIETERGNEKSQATKRATLVAFVVSLPGAAVALWKLWKP